MREAVVRRAPQVLAWFDDRERSATDLLLQEGVRSNSVWDARLGFIEDTLGKLTAAVSGIQSYIIFIVRDSRKADYEGARAAGLHTLLLERSGDSPAAGASHVIANLEELLVWLESGASSPRQSISD